MVHTAVWVLLFQNVCVLIQSVKQTTRYLQLWISADCPAVFSDLKSGGNVEYLSNEPSFKAPLHLPSQQLVWNQSTQLPIKAKVTIMTCDWLLQRAEHSIFCYQLFELIPFCVFPCQKCICCIITFDKRGLYFNQ